MSDVVWVDDDNNEILRIPADHLPECPVFGFEPPPAPEPLIWPRCICDRLRACEQRVLTEAPVSVFVKAFTDGKEVGFAAALDEAIRAVEALQGDSRNVGLHQMKRDALAALRALRDGGSNV